MANCKLNANANIDIPRLVYEINDYIASNSKANSNGEVSFSMMLRYLQKVGFESLPNIDEKWKNTINIFTPTIVAKFPKGSKPLTETSRNWLKGENGQIFMAQAQDYQNMLDANDTSDPQEILDLTNNWIKDNMGTVESKGTRDKKEPNLEEIKHILRKNVWTCINCEANNSYALANCEVCDTERYFSFAEVKILMQYF